MDGSEGTGRPVRKPGAVRREAERSLPPEAGLLAAGPWRAGARRARSLALPLALLLAGCEVVGGFETFERGSGAPGGAAGAAGAGGGGGQGCSPPVLPGPAMVGVQREGGGCLMIDQTEVTRAHYKLFLDAQVPVAGQPDHCRKNDNYAPDPLCEQDLAKPFDTGHPMTCVDWCDAAAFCKWAQKRLCKGSFAVPEQLDKNEWYAVCSSGGEAPFPYGKVFTKNRCNGQNAQPVGSLAKAGAFPDCATPEGVVDMVGNASEWVDECQSEISEDDLCHARGGSFRDEQEGMTCALRVSRSRLEEEPHLGFRCCLDMP